MATVGTVAVDLVARTGTFETDFARAARVAKQHTESISASTVAMGVAMGEALFRAAESVAHFVESTVHNTVELAHLAEKTGLTAQALGGLRLAATESGVDMDRLAKTITKVAGIQFDAAAGSKKAAAEMKFFGITAKDTADGAVDKLLKGFEAMPPSFDRAGLAVKIFGQRLGTDFLLVADKAKSGLNGLEKAAADLGVGLDEKTLKAAEQFEISMRIVNLQFQAIGEEVLTGVLPILDGFVKALADPAINANFKQMASDAITTFATIIEWAGKANSAIADLGRASAARDYGAAVGDSTNLKAENARISDRLKFLDSLRNPQNGPDPAKKIWASLTTDPFATGATGNLSVPLDQEEQILQKRLATNKKYLSQTTQMEQEASAAKQAADKAAAKTAADSAKVRAAATAQAKAGYDELVKMLGEHKGGKGKKDPADAAFTSFDDYAVGLMDKQFSTGNRVLDEYNKALQELVKHYDEAIKKGVAASEIAADFAGAKGALKDKRDVGLAQEDQKRTDQVSEYNALVKDQIAYRENILDLQIASASMGAKEAQMAAEINAIHQNGERQILSFQNELKNKLHGVTDEATVERWKKTYAALIAITKSGEATEIEDIKRAAIEKAQIEGNWRNGAARAFANFQDQAKDVAGQTEQLFNNAFQGAQDALLNFVNTGKLNFKDFAKSIIVDIERIIIKMLVLKAIEAVIGGFGPNNGATSGGSFGYGAGYGPSVIGSANGNAFSNGNIIPFASGGIVDRATPFGMSGGRMGVMGEAGAEAIVPLSRGADGKLGIRAQGGGDVTVNTTVVVDNGGNTKAQSTGADQAQARAFAQLIETKVQEGITTARRQGGQLWAMANGR